MADLSVFMEQIGYHHFFTCLDGPMAKPGSGDTALFDQTISDANESLITALTRRELEVLALMGKGRTNREISNDLDISPHTVKSHVINIFNKLSVSDRTQAAVWAVRHQII